MWKFILAVTLLLFFSNNYLHNFLATTIKQSHQICLARFQDAPATAHFYRTVVCAARTENGFSGTGVLLMVSSLQIVWLEVLLTFYFRRQSLPGSIVIPLVIFLYALATGLHPVVVRAVFQLFVQRTCHREKWGWPPLYCSTIASLLALIAFPNFLMSIGFFISWIAATWARIIFSRSSSSTAKPHYRYFIFLFFIYPVFFGLPFSQSVSLGTLIGWLIRPLLLALLIPPSFLVFVFPILHYAVDPIWRMYNWTIQTLEYNFGSLALSLHSSLFFLWCYLVVSLAFGFWIIHHQRRKQIWQDSVTCDFF